MPVQSLLTPTGETVRLSRLAATLTLGVLLTLAGTSCGSTRASDSSNGAPTPVTSKPLTGVCKELFNFTNAPGAAQRTAAENLVAYDEMAPLMPPELEQAYADLRTGLKSAADGKGNKSSAESGKKQVAALATFTAYMKNTCGVG